MLRSALSKYLLDAPARRKHGSDHMLYPGSMVHGYMLLLTVLCRGTRWHHRGGMGGRNVVAVFDSKHGYPVQRTEDKKVIHTYSSLLQ